MDAQHRSLPVRIAHAHGCTKPEAAAWLAANVPELSRFLDAAVAARKGDPVATEVKAGFAISPGSFVAFSLISLAPTAKRRRSGSSRANGLATFPAAWVRLAGEPEAFAATLRDVLDGR